MARFYGQIVGRDHVRSETRIGRWFLKTTCSSYAGTILTELYVDPVSHEECVRITVVPGTVTGPRYAYDFPKSGAVLYDKPISALVDSLRKRGMFKQCER